MNILNQKLILIQYIFKFLFYEEKTCLLTIWVVFKRGICNKTNYKKIIGIDWNYTKYRYNFYPEKPIVLHSLLRVRATE